MANKESVIDVIFNGIDNVTGTVNRIASGVGDLGNGMGKFFSPFADAGNAVLKLDAALCTLAAGGLAVAFVKAKEFDSAMTGLKKVFGDELPATLAKAKSFAIDISETYGVSSASVLESIAGWKQAGFDAKTSMELAKQSLDAVIAGDVDIATATELQTAALKGFAVNADTAGESAEKLNNIVNAVSNTYATNFQELLHAMGDISPIAKQMGFSMEETAGILTPVIEVFRSGSESATAFKTGLLRIIGDSKRVRDALHELGVAQKDANGKLRSGRDIYMDIAAAFKNLDENRKVYLAKELVGIEQSARMVTAFNNMNKTMAVTETAMKSAGSAAEEVAVRMESSEVIFNRYIKSLENLAVKVGEKFQEASKSALKGGTSINKALRQSLSDGAFDPLFDKLNDMMERFADASEQIAKMLPEALKKIDYKGLLAGFDGLQDDIADMFDGLDLSTPQGLADAIQLVIDGVEALINVTGGIVTAWKPVVDTISAVYKWFIDLDDKTQALVGTFLGFSQQAVVMAGGFTTISLAINGLGGQMTGLSKMLPGLGKSIGLVGAGFAGWEVGTALRKWIPEIDGATQSIFAHIDAWTNFSGQGDHAMDTLDGIVDDMYRAKTAAAEMGDATGKAADEVKDLAATDDVKISVGVDTKTGDLKTVADKIDDLDGKEVKVGMSLDEFNAKRAELAKVGKDIESINAKGEIKVCAKVDKKSVDGAYGIIKKILPDGTLYYTYNAKPNKESLEKAKKEIEAAIPPVKKLEIQAEIEKERIKAQSEEIADYLKYKAEIDVAEIEAATERIAAMSETINTGLQSTGEVIGDIVASFGGLSRDVEGSTADNTQARWRLEEQLARENELRERQVKLQEELVKAQVDYMNAKTDAMERGEAMIRIDATGLQEPLQSLFLAVIQECQVYATDEGLGFLGIP